MYGYLGCFGVIFLDGACALAVAAMHAVALLSAMALLMPTPPPRPRSEMPDRTLARRDLVSAALASAFCMAGAVPASAIPPLHMLLLPEQGGIAMPAVEAPPPMVLYTPPSVKGMSSPEAIALAKHLKAKGELWPDSE